jgi:VWFA-related protein
MTDAFARSEDVFTRMARHMEGTFEFLSRDHQGFTTTNAPLALIAALSELPGRKSVVLFAESLALPLAVQGRFDSVIQNANRANVAIYAVDAAGLRVHSDQGQVGRELQCLGVSAGVQADCENVFARLGMGYYSADLVVDLLQKDPATALGSLSRATGGFLINNTNDLARGFHQDRRRPAVPLSPHLHPDERAVGRRVAERDGARPRSPGERAGEERLRRGAGTRGDPVARARGTGPCRP